MRIPWRSLAVTLAVALSLAVATPADAANFKKMIKSAWNKLRKPPTPRPAGNQALQTRAAPARAPTAVSPGMMNRAAAAPIGNAALAPARVPPPTGRPMGVANAAAQAPAPSASAQTQWNQPIRPQPVAAVAPVGNRTQMPGSPRRAMADLKTAAKPDVYGRTALPPPPSTPPGPVVAAPPAVALPPPPPPMASPGSAASSVRTPVIYERLPPRPQVMFPIPGPPGATPPPVVTPPGARAPGPPIGPQPVIYSKLPSGGPVAAGGAAGAIAQSRTGHLGMKPTTSEPPVTKMVPREALVNSPNVGRWTPKDGTGPVIGARPYIRGQGPDAIQANMRQSSARADQAMAAAARAAPPPTPVANLTQGLQKAVNSKWQASVPQYGLNYPSLIQQGVSAAAASRFNAEYQAILKRTQVSVEKR